MKNLFNAADADEILARIEELSPSTIRQWGKMDVAQMLTHCGNVLEMGIVIVKPKRQLIGRLIGGLFKSKYSDEQPFSKGSPTSSEAMVVDLRNFEVEKVRLIGLIKKFSKEKIVTAHPHPFFGKLEPAQWSRGMYKHLDHHLRQFGV